MNNRMEANLKKRTPVEDVISFINSTGCKFISFVGEYENYKTKVNIICRCGHKEIKSIQIINRPSFSGVCRDCSTNEGNIKKRLNLETITNLIESYGFNSIKFPNNYYGGKSLVSYSCEHGHETLKSITSFKHNPTCSKCKKIEMSERFSGENGINWNGGTTQIKKFLQKKLTSWKKDSMKNCNYQCVITGDSFDEIHHLYSFANIIQDCFEELGIEVYTDISKYSQDEINSIIRKMDEIHNRYPLGVCLRKDIHLLFHKIYGTDGKTTPEDFYEFVERINNGEIKIK